jgi:hypothetical protein
MKKAVIVFISIFAVPFLSEAQHLSKNNFKNLQMQEDTLQIYSHDMILQSLAPQRFEALTKFTPILVRALKTPYSFQYPFDSLQTVSIIYAPDSSFRIFTWELEKDESYYREYGAIQMNTKDGSLKLFPLIDESDFTPNPTDSVRNNLTWIGAIYYNIVMKSFKNKKYYTLLGYDDNDFQTTRKWIEVLTFANDGKPQFGGQYFSYTEDSIKPPQPAYRFCLEYKKDAKARMDYDADMDMIVFEHLISESNNLAEKFTLIPDGDYEGFKWQDGKWVYVNKVFSQKLDDGQFPVPEPIKDDNGNSDENKLNQQSDKNMKQKPPGD